MYSVFTFFWVLCFIVAMYYAKEVFLDVGSQSSTTPAGDKAMQLSGNESSGHPSLKRRGNFED
jgi:hypothetical protein